MISERVEQTTLTTGTGTLVLDDTIPTGRRSFASAFGNGGVCYAVLETSDRATWEHFIGTVTDGTPDTLSRTQVIRSSAGVGVPANFPAGIKRVYTREVGDAARFGYAGNIPQTGGTAQAMTAAFAPAVLFLREGMRFVVRAAANAASSGTTLNVNGLGAKPVRKAQGTTEIAANDWLAGDLLDLVYDAQGGGRFRIAQGFTRNDAVPSGSMMMWVASTPPLGWLECNGQSTASYPTLAAVIGGSVPDMRGVFPRGWDNGRGVDPGRGIASYQAGSVQSHNHTASVTDPGHNHQQTGNNGYGNQIGGTGSGMNGPTGSPNSIWQLPITQASGTGISVSIGSTGGTETRPQNVSLMFIIKI